VPETDVVKLEMSVAEGIKFIMSLGAVSPAYLSQEGVVAIEAMGDSKRTNLRRNGEAHGDFVRHKVFDNDPCRLKVYSGEERTSS